MFVGILLHDPMRDFGVEFESLRHREIFKISTCADKKLQGATLNEILHTDDLIKLSITTTMPKQ